MARDWLARWLKVGVRVERLSISDPMFGHDSKEVVGAWIGGGVERELSLGGLKNGSEV